MTRPALSGGASSASETALAHHFTVDVEEYFHSTLLTEALPASGWDGIQRRARPVVEWMLDRMDEVGARGTFFVLGWLAEQEPGIVRSIAERGHEIAAHTWWHRKVTAMTPEEFRDDARRTKAFLEDVGGTEVVGFRAPSFSIRPGYEWAFDVLLEEGYRYDSSLFPIEIHPGYGYPAAQSDPYPIERPSGSLYEFPLTTLRVLGRRLPAAGGAYLRFFPDLLPRRAVRQTARRGAPGMLYIHPWDLDPGVPPVPLPPLSSLRLKGGAGRARRRFVRLLRSFQWTTVGDSLSRLVEGEA